MSVSECQRECHHCKKTTSLPFDYTTWARSSNETNGVAAFITRQYEEHIWVKWLILRKNYLNVVTIFLTG